MSSLLLTCGFETLWDDVADAPASFNSYTDFEAVVTDCGNEVAIDAPTLTGTWTSSWTEADASTTTLTVVYVADNTGYYSEDNDSAGNLDSCTFN